MKRERLFSHIPLPRISKVGISDQDIARIKVVDELVKDILDCLQSEDTSDIAFGCYFAECLRSRADFYACAKSSLPTMASLIRKELSNPSPQVRDSAIRAFIAFRESYDDYGSVMREFLCSPDSIIRRATLGASPTFLSVKELDKLLPFRDDKSVSETGGMGGPLRYDIRDFALEMAERMTGKQFNCGDCFEQREGLKVSWRSWSSFVQWVESKKKWRLLSV